MPIPSYRITNRVRQIGRPFATCAIWLRMEAAAIRPDTEHRFNSPRSETTNQAGDVPHFHTRGLCVPPRILHSAFESRDIEEYDVRRSMSSVRSGYFNRNHPWGRRYWCPTNDVFRSQRSELAPQTDHVTLAESRITLILFLCTVM